MAFDGQRLKKAREALSQHRRPMTQERFAELIGVSKRSPGRWENGEAAPRMRQLQRLAEVTGQPVGWFFGEDAVSGSLIPPIQQVPLADLLQEMAEALLVAAREARERAGTASVAA